MKAWGELRKSRPSLFNLGVWVWGRPTAYMDEVICLWHSELIAAEAPQALLAQDCFSGELAP
eukprot:11047371-Lingulodinium_polyedra.AAC.1